MCAGTGLSLLVMLGLVPLSSTAGMRCTIPTQDAHKWSSSPLMFSSNETVEAGRLSQCVSLHILLQPKDFIHERTRKINIPSSSIHITIKKSSPHNIKWKMEYPPEKGECTPTFRKNHTLWELEYACVRAQAGSTVSALFIDSTRNTENYIVPDPVPQFQLSVDAGSRTVHVTVTPGAKVNALLCYRVDKDLCRSDTKPITIDPEESLTAALNISYLLPCLCLQVYYTHSDAKRVTECPFTNISLEAVGEVWLAGKVRLYKDKVAWSSPCPSRFLKPSAALCWRDETGRCTRILNSSLEIIPSSSLLYNISTLDKHSRMCLQFSFKNNHHVHCPFESDEDLWEAGVHPGWRSMSVHLTSHTRASFSAELCVLHRSACLPIGHTFSGTTDEATGELWLHVSVHNIAERPCVQVWQVAPARLGKRILCPNYMHWRSGVVCVVALVMGVTLALLGLLVWKVIRRGTTGWLSIHKPVLLVCSSGQPAHVSAVCALASILQGELCAGVRMALWSRRSDRRSGVGGGAGGAGEAEPAAGSGVADLGPLPWLYGEWDAVQRAQGKLLLVWSPEAKRVFERTGEQKTDAKHAQRSRWEGTRRGDPAGQGTALPDGKPKDRTSAVGTESHALLDADDGAGEGSSVTGPVLRATLARLRGALQEPGRTHPVVLISLRGLNHNRDIPAELRGVPRYSLPRDFSGLIQELGAAAQGPHWGGLECGCWPPLRAKILSLWLARRLAHRLQTWLPSPRRQLVDAGTAKSGDGFEWSAMLDR